MSLLSWFDNRTLFACQTLLAMVFTLVFFGVRRIYPDLRGVASVALSFLFGIPATFLLSSSGVLPYFVSTVIATCFIFTSFTLLYHGILRFLGSKRSIFPVVVLGLLTIAVVFYFTQVHRNIVPCIVTVSFAIALARGLVAIQLFLHAEGRTTTRLFASSMTFFAIMSLNRGVQTLLHGAPADYLQRDTVQTFTLASGLVSVCLTGIFFLMMCNSRSLALVRTESKRDLLSGAFNRRGIEQKLALELKRLERSHQKLCIALIDIDHFKAINDNFGHAAGDDALRAVAAAVSNGLRAHDCLGRYGGDEFLLVLPRTTCSDAFTVSEQVGHSVRSTSSGNALPVTVSIGLTEAVPGEAATDLLARADKALYAAKHAGRNCSRALLHESHAESLDMQTPLLVS